MVGYKIEWTELKVDNTLDMLRGEVKRAYNINAQPGVIYEYLSDMRTLLSRVPNAQKLQLRKSSGRARIFFNMNILSYNIDIVIDVEPVREPQNHYLKLIPPPEPLGVIPPGHLTGKFEADIQITPNDKGGSRVITHIALEFDPSEIAILNIVPPSIVKTTGLVLLQDYVNNMSSDYIVRLSQDFPIWLKEKAKA